jgi:hypothetical protein
VPRVSDAAERIDVRLGGRDQVRGGSGMHRGGRLCSLPFSARELGAHIAGACNSEQQGRLASQIVIDTCRSTSKSEAIPIRGRGGL